MNYCVIKLSQDLTNPLYLLQEFVALKTVTPDQGEGISLLASWLDTLGFETQYHEIGSGNDMVMNLFAKKQYGNDKTAPILAFAGHSDVVPAGDETAWQSPPYKLTMKDGHIYGRGVADMKGAITAFIAAIARHQQAQTMPQKGAIAFLITGDEEGPAHNGTNPLLKRLHRAGERFDACLTGEPTSDKTVGDVIKIGRRGSFHGDITVSGRQGHTGYPHLAINAAHQLAEIAHSLASWRIDEGTEFFEPSVLSLSSINVENVARNVIPGKGRLRFNIRYNDLHDGESLRRLIDDKLSTEFNHINYQFDHYISGDSFITKPGSFTNCLSDAIKSISGVQAKLSTSGGTSDSRFIKDYCPVVDFGLRNQTIHQIDEMISQKDLEDLTNIYHALISRFFN